MNDILQTLTAPFTRVDAMPSLLLVAVWFGLLRRFRYSGYGIALLAVIGTSLHEATHFLVGWLLRAKPVSVNLFPRREGNAWVLGSVGFTGLNLFNAAFVAFAPLLLLAVAWSVFAWWLLPAFLAGQYVSWFLAGYVAACALFSSIPSGTDIRIGALSALMYAALGYGVWNLAH
ncbi:hypothetical protein [Burkholderia ambifaria]|uniref:hypothetical protein n=1 Tax=Burkholderia ambifaria TaxID=152480 RepID=UPI000F80A3FB|nr:hypothetical protein [Burkholderia ambifaria]